MPPPAASLPIDVLERSAPCLGPLLPHLFPPAADRTENLMWRLLYGELPAARTPKLVVLSTGQNDLLSAYLANTRQGEANTLKAVDGIVARWEGTGGKGW